MAGNTGRAQPDLGTAMTSSVPTARLAGLVASVEGATITLTAPHAAQPETQYLGEPNPRGTVGEFLLVKTRGFTLLARLTKVELSQRDMHRASWQPGSPPPDTPVGEAQLLATVQPDGGLRAGVEAMPRIGDSVFSATSDLLTAGIGSIGGGISLGHLSQNSRVPVHLNMEALLGRHLAVLGSTGGGKSWTVAHLAEEVRRAGGRLLLLDASGEYATLGTDARHLVASSTGASLPLHEMSDSDRILFFRPSSGSQLPKMAAAIASLRLAAVLGESHTLVSSGNIVKKGLLRAAYQRAERDNADVVNDPHARFDVTKLVLQIGYECVYPNDRNRQDCFGDINHQEIAYCSTLMTRISETCRAPAVMDFIAPSTSGSTLLGETMGWLASGDSGILRIDLSELPQTNYLREITVNTIGARLLEAARAGDLRANPLVVAIDEAHQFLGRTLGEDQASVRPESFELIAKEGRKFGLSLIVATQRPGDIPGGVLSQMGCLIVHRLTERRDQDHVADASSHLDRTLAHLLPALVPGECLIVGSALPLAIPVKLSPPQHLPNSDGPHFASWNPVTA